MKKVLLLTMLLLTPLAFAKSKGGFNGYPWYTPMTEIFKKEKIIYQSVRRDKKTVYASTKGTLLGEDVLVTYHFQSGLLLAGSYAVFNYSVQKSLLQFIDWQSSLVGRYGPASVEDLDLTKGNALLSNLSVISKLSVGYIELRRLWFLEDCTVMLSLFKSKNYYSLILSYVHNNFEPETKF